MITKIFKRLSIFSYIVSFFLTLAVNLFDLYSRNAAEIYPGLFQRALTISSGLIIIIVMVSLSATKKINTKFGAEHLLSFPVCLLLFYQDAGLNYQKFFLGIILVIALNIFSKDWSKGNSNKALFSLGCLFTITSFINSYFSKKQKKESESMIEDGANYLQENAKREGVTTLPSGLQYEVINDGTGPMPTIEDNVTTHYHGTLIDGTVFDSSVDRGEPASFPVGGVIKGWTEALQLMSVGSKWKLYVPYDLAYGERGAGAQIGPYSTLIFEVELISIN